MPAHAQRRSSTALLTVALLGCGGEPWLASGGAAVEGSLPQNEPFPNPTGSSATVSATGPIDLGGPFFAPSEVNGRSCATCHEPSDGWSITPRTARALFDASDGHDPLFALDGQDCEGLDRSTAKARRAASSLMLTRGLVRLHRPVPAGDAVELELVAWEGKTCGAVDPTQLVLFRRPRPTTNFAGMNQVLWDGIAGPDTVDQELRNVIVGATMIHGQLPPPPAERIEAVLAFMRSLSTAQVFDAAAGDLAARGALGGAGHLASLPVDGPAGFGLFDSWADARPDDGASTQAARVTVARGQALFNARGCVGCHAVSNRGHSAARIFADIGISDPARRTSDLPLYTFRRKATGETRQLTDPGRGLVTGRWSDLGRFAVPGLRALAARAPYFHDGSAATLKDVVAHYDARFGLGLSKSEKADLEAFLASL
jgi:cytochrome c peroxidase